MKFVYYGFGGFIGGVCGVVINMVFYWLEKSGTPLLTNLGREYGALGRFVGELVNTLPMIGVVLGVVLVRTIFKTELEKMD
jgi:hypothetical protein